MNQSAPYFLKQKLNLLLLIILLFSWFPLQSFAASCSIPDEVKTLEHSDPDVDFQKAIKQGNTHFFAFIGMSTYNTPPIDFIVNWECYWHIVKVKPVEGTTDAICGKEHSRLQDIAWEYIKSFNGEMYKYLKANNQLPLCDKNILIPSSPTYSAKSASKTKQKLAEIFKDGEKDGWDQYIKNDYGYKLAELGSIYFSLKKYNLAIEETQRAINYVSDDYSNKFWLYNNLGVIYRAHGKLDKAKEAFKKSLEINPDQVFARDHLESLNNHL